MSDIGWNPGPTIAAVTERLRRGLSRVGAGMEATGKELVSRPNTPVRGPRGGRARGIDPSKPGEPPKRVFGHLRVSIAFQVIVRPGLIILRFGVLRNGPASAYARALEFGFAGVRTIAAHQRIIGPGYRVTGKTKLRFSAKMGPPQAIGVKPFVRSFALAARPYIRPTYNLWLPKIPSFLQRRAS